MKASEIREAIANNSRMRVEARADGYQIVSASDFASDCDEAETLTDEELELAFDEWLVFDDYMVEFEAKVLDK